MADIDKDKYSYNKQFRDRWEIEVDEHDPNLKAKKVKVVGGEVSLSVSDIEIGAVEIKDKDSDNRVRVNTDGSLDVNVVNIILQNYITNDIDDYSESNIMYVGKEDKFGNWLILKIDMNTGTIIRGASNKNNNTITTYIDAWNNRLSLTYNYLKEVI